MKSIDIGEIHKHPTSAPTLPRLLLVHGNDLCAEFYTPLAHALAARGVRSTLVTLPGFRGEPPLPDPSWASLVDAIVGLAAAKANDDGAPMILAGHSMGGLFALLVAARRSAWLCGLALLEPAIFPSRLVARVAARRYLGKVVLAPDGARESALFENWNGGMRRVADVAVYPRAALDVYLDARRTADIATGRALFASMASLYPLPFDDVRAPCLVVAGAQTGLLGRAMVAHVRRRLRATLVTVDGAAHWLANEADDAVADALAAFAARCIGSVLADRKEDDMPARG